MGNDEIPPSMEKNAFLSMDNNRELKIGRNTSSSSSSNTVTTTIAETSNIKHETSKSMTSIIAGGFAGILAKTGKCIR